MKYGNVLRKTTKDTYRHNILLSDNNKFSGDRLEFWFNEFALYICTPERFTVLSLQSVEDCLVTSAQLY